MGAVADCGAWVIDLVDFSKILQRRMHAVTAAALAFRWNAEPCSCGRFSNPHAEFDDFSSARGSLILISASLTGTGRPPFAVMVVRTFVMIWWDKRDDGSLGW